MKKIITLFVFAVFALTLIVPVQSRAQTVSELQIKINELLSEIATLKAKINVLEGTQAKQAELLQILTTLQFGVQSDDVKILQAFLSIDADVYPQALISGYFGSLTQDAVQRYQAKYGIISSGSPANGFGVVGPKTRAKINEQLANDANVLTEDAVTTSSNDVVLANGKKLCLPPGHLIAPGQIKKGLPNLPSCKNPLPPGIQKNITKGGPGNPNATTTPDITPPVISQIVATSTTQTTGNVTWLTNELATSALWYATTSPTSTTTATKVSKAGFYLSHSLDIMMLATNTTYYFFVDSSDASNNRATSSVYSFTTRP